MVCSQCAVGVLSVCSQCAVGVLSVCCQCAVSVQSVCSRCTASAIGTKSVCSRFTVTACTASAIGTKSVRDWCVRSLQSVHVCSHCTVMHGLGRCILAAQSIHTLSTHMSTHMHGHMSSCMSIHRFLLFKVDTCIPYADTRIKLFGCLAKEKT